MKNVVLFFIVFFVNKPCISQIEFKGQNIKEYTFGSSFQFNLYKQIDSIYRLDKNYEFEFRLWLNQDITPDCKLFILSGKDGRLNCRYFKYDVTSVNEIQEIKLSNEGINSLWDKLLRNNLLTLPTQDSIRHKMVRYTTDFKNFENQPIQNKGFSDCDSYDFELFTLTKFRTYNYYCPRNYIEIYPQTEEFYRAYVIISLVKEFILNNSN